MLKVYKGVFKSDWKEIVDVEMRKNHMYKIILYVIAFQFIFINLRMKNVLYSWVQKIWLNLQQNYELSKVF